MLAKVIVWALDWNDVISRGERALKDMGVEGIRTTIPYYLEILRSADFRSGSFDTSFVDNHPELNNYSCKRRKDELAVALAAAIAAHAGL